tara:strand:+ start:15668 stop:18166 length:2499 start_codon:yes stop_codon:yes gene_type:complete
MANHIQRAYKLKLDGITVLGTTGEGRLTVFNEDGVTETVDVTELSVKVAELENCAPCNAAISINNFSLNSSPTTNSIETTTRINPGGTVYLWHTGCGLAAPTVAQMTTSSNTFTASAGIDTVYTISDLTPNTCYRIYSYAVDESGNSTVIGGNGTYITNSTLESIQLSSFYLDGDASYASITTSVTTNENGTVYLWVTGSGLTAPSVEDFKNSSFTSPSTADTPLSLSINNLSELTQYTAYAYAEDGDGYGTIIGGGNSFFNFTTIQEPEPLTIDSFSKTSAGNSTLTTTASISNYLRFTGEGATGYAYAVESGSSLPTASEIKSNAVTFPASSGVLTANTNELLTVYSLTPDTPYTVYSYVEKGNSASVIGAANTFYSERTYPTMYPLEKGYTGSITSSSFSIYWAPKVPTTGYFLTYTGSEMPSASDLLASPYVVIGDTPLNRYTITFTDLEPETTYYVTYYPTIEAGVVSDSVPNIGQSHNFLYPEDGALTHPESNSLLSNGLKARFFGWNDPNYVADSDYTSSVSILDGASATPSSHDVVSSSVEYTDGKSLTGVFKNMTYNRTESIGQNGFAMTGLQFDGQNDFISIPQLQNNSKGLWDSEFTFLTENSADTSYPSGFSITYWIRPLWGVDHGPSSNQDYKPWSLGNSSAKSLGLYHKFDGSDRPAQLRGNSSNYMYSNSAANPPDPWDELYDTGNWTFMSVVYNGDELAPGYSADKFSDAFTISVGTGLPSEGNIFFYSGDGSSAGLSDDITIQGANYAGYGSTSNSLIDLTQNYCATLGVQLKSDGSLANNDLAYWPGLLCDFRIYGRQISTGEAYSIFTGAGIR